MRPLPLLPALLLLGCSAPEPAVCDRADLEPAGPLDVHVQQASAPRATLVLFHGLGESACTWTDRTEGSRLASLAVDAGFAVVAVDSGTRSWSTGYPENDDALAVDDALDALRDDDRIPDGPLLGLGHSNGGAFAPIWAATSSHEVRAVVAANTWSTEALGSSELPPLLFVSAENDLVIPKALTAAAVDRAEGAGHVVERIHDRRKVVESERFARIDGVSADDSRRLVQALDDAGLLNAEGRLRSNPRLDPRWRDALPDDLVEHEEAIEEQLHVLYAEHRFSSDNAAAFLTLFDSALE